MKTSFLYTLNNYKHALLAAIFFGCIAPGTKFLTYNLPPQATAGLLYLFAGLGLFVLILVKGKLLSSFSAIKKIDLKWFFLASFFGGLLGPACFTYGIIHASGTSASLLLNMEAVLTSMIAWFIFKEHFDKKILYGMLLIIIGCMILSLRSTTSTNENSLLGWILIFSSCLFWAIDNNFTRKIAHLDPVLTVSMKGLIAGSSNLFLSYIIGEKIFLNSSLFYVAILGILGIGISLVCFIISLNSIGTARTGAIFSSAPFIGSIIAITFLGEHLTIPVSFAFLFMAGGVWLHLSENHGHEHTHHFLEHKHIHDHTDEHHQHQHLNIKDTNVVHDHHHKHSRMKHKHLHFPDTHHQHKH